MQPHEQPNEGLEPPMAGEPTPRKDQRRAALRSGLGVVVAALVALGVWFAFFGRPDPDKVTPAPEPVTLAEPAPEPEPPLDRAASDALVRDAARPLSADPTWSEWLGAGDLARRLAAAAGAVARGESPREPLSMLAPEGDFQVVVTPNGTHIAESSFARYDTVARVLDSIDPNAAATAWAVIAPVVRRAWSEIGRPGSRVETALASAIERLVSVPVPDAPVQVKARGAIWEFADPEMEGRSAAEKHLLRMGPENQRLVQTRLKSLGRALNLPLM